MQSKGNFGLRLTSAVTTSSFLIGVFGGIDSILVMMTSPHLFHSILERAAFLVFAIGIYGIAGAAAGLFVAFIPIKWFVSKAELDKNALAIFYLSLLLTFAVCLVVLVESVTFLYFYLHPVRDTVIIVATLLASYICVRFLFKVLGSSDQMVARLARVLGLFHRKVLVFAFLFVFAFSSVFLLRETLQRYATDSKPNIILISFDTLSANHMGCYGYSEPTTPNIDRFAQEGVLFSNHFSVSRTTLTSHMSMLTSTFPSVHKVYDSFSSVLDERFLTMAEVLTKHGYESGAFVDSPRELNLGADHGFDHGFEFYEHYQEKLLNYEKLYLIKRFLNFGANVLHRMGIPDMHSKKIFSAAATWLSKRAQDRPFFLFLHTYDIHSDFGTRLPYVTPKSFQDLAYRGYQGDFTGCNENGKCATDYLVEINTKLRRGQAHPSELLSEEDVKYITSLYDCGIQYTDYRFGQFVEQLDRLNLLENTIVALTADHGEEFYQHGQMKHVQYYDEVLKVPLIIHYPKKIRRGMRIDDLTRSIDILPTLFELAGIEDHPAQFQGTSLVPLLSDDHGAQELTLFGGEDRPQDIDTRFMRTSTHKLILNGAERRGYYFNKNKPQELYNINIDPHELNNLAHKDSATVAALLAQMLEWKTTCSDLYKKIIPTENAKQITLDEKAKEELRSLGYIK